VRTIVAALALAALTACVGDSEEGTRFAERGIALTAPSTWSVTGFSVNVTPHRLVAASYDVRAADVEGDCGGQAAVTRLPRDGAYLVLIDYGAYPRSVDTDDFGEERPTSGRDEPFRRDRFAHFECFGPSHAFLFVIEGRALQAHLGIGSDATAERRDEAVEVLRSIIVERDPP
jgi:hypothetical protein